MNQRLAEFLSKIPKSDLHVHLDGSLRLSTLIELAQTDKVKLPSYTEDGLKQLVFKDSYKDLPDYLKGFAYTCDVLRKEENLERVSYELAVDSIAENVRYLEVRLAPQLHLNANLNFIQIINAVGRGLERARKEYSNKLKESNSDDIPFRYGVIVIAMRCFNEHYSPYFANLLNNLKYTKKKDVFKTASMELARASVAMKNDYDSPIVGFDLAGEEAGYPPVLHKEAYDYIHKNFMGKTVHAGEAYGPESIFQAVTECHANRIGHGTSLFSHESIQDPDIVHPEQFSDKMANYLASRRISIEVCPTSNLQTLQFLKNDMKNHPVKQMIDNRLSVTICTDNRLVSNTTVTKELSLLVNAFDLSPKQLRDIVIAGFKGSFFYSDYVNQRKFIRSAIDRYDKLAKETLA